jgi:hypothetical protein
MKNLINLSAAAILLLGTAAAQADGKATSVTVTGIAGYSTGLVLIYISGTISGGPSCATTNKGFAVDGSTKGGAVVLSMAEMAHTLGKTVTMDGTGLCGVMPGWESLRVIELRDPQRG